MTRTIPSIPDHGDYMDLDEAVQDINPKLANAQKILAAVSDYTESYQGLLAALIDEWPQDANELAIVSKPVRRVVDDVTKSVRSYYFRLQAEHSEVQDLLHDMAQQDIGAARQRIHGDRFGRDDENE